MNWADAYETCSGALKECRESLAAETRRANSAEAELRETAGELEKARDRCAGQERLTAKAVVEATVAAKRLTEATAPLERAESHIMSGKWLVDYGDWKKSRVPAQPASPDVPWDTAFTSENEHLRSELAAVKAERDRLLVKYQDALRTVSTSNDACTSARASEAALRERVTNCVNHLRDVTAAARRNREPKTGMQVPYHGEFASAVPSVIRDLEWFVRAFDRALTAGPTGQEGESRG
jgi:hypothetical protein